MPVARRAEQHWVACGYEHEAVVEQAVMIAVDALTSWVGGGNGVLEPQLSTLRSLAAARAIDAASQALIDEAFQRGIPVIRLEESGRRFQLGWGRNQRTFEAQDATVFGVAPNGNMPLAEQARARLDVLFPLGANGRIPTVSITGTQRQNNDHPASRLCLTHRSRRASHGRHNDDAGCVAAWFAMDESNAWIATGRDLAGITAWLDSDDWLMLGKSDTEHRLIEAAQMPIAMQGHAHHNIANALAAAAALSALGLEPVAIGAALASFVSDARSNPMRSNRYQISGKTVVVDCGHNLAAYRALCDMARSMLSARGGRLLGVITAPGDRRAADLLEVGALRGEGFDELVVYEKDPRGRSNGETANAIIAGARSTAGIKKLHCITQIPDAFAYGLTRAGPNDVVVFTSAGTLEEVIEGIRRVDPAAATPLAAETAN